MKHKRRGKKMKYAIFARGFIQNEKRKLGVLPFLSCFLIGLAFVASLNAYYRTPLSVLNIQFSKSYGFEMAPIIDVSNDRKARVTNSTKKSDSHAQKVRVNISEEMDSHDPKAEVTKRSEKSDSHNRRKKVTNSSEKLVKLIQPWKIKPLLTPICNFSHPKSDFCEIKDGDIRINANSSTILIVSPSQLIANISAGNSSWSIKPHARKTDGYVMSKIREFTLKPPASSDRKSIPRCTKNHRVPGILFSAGGYAGNVYHDFADIIVPLYITSRHFKGKVKFLVANAIPSWLVKYKILLKALSKYRIIKIDRDQEIHCFRSLIVGLKEHQEFAFDPSRPGPDGIYTMQSFTRFVRRAYSLKRDTVLKLSDGNKEKPRLYIMSRMKTRTIVNVNELATEARSLGYEVEVAEAGRRVEQFSKFLNSFDVMVGVHGAGLTNMVYLPQRVVLIQIVPLGLDWHAMVDYEMPARAMNLRYLEYKISTNESTLTEKYPIDHQVFRDPSSFMKQGWVPFRKIYLDAQNVRLDIRKFRTTLLKALELLHE